MAPRRSQALQKRRTKQRKRRKEQLQRRSDIERMLIVMGLHDLVKLYRLPDDRLHRLTGPKPAVLPAPDQAHDPRLSQLARELKRKLDRVTTTVGEIHVTFNDYWSIGLPLVDKLARVSTAGSSDETGFSSEILRHASEISERLGEDLFAEYEEATLAFLAEHSRFDACLYTARHIPPSDEFPTLGTILSRHAPETASIVEWGAGRKAYRCGASANSMTGEITWVSWNPEPLGWGKGRPLPVYIQSHAIEQAVRRLRIHGREGLLQHYVWRSLRAPRLTPREDGCFLVDLMVNDGKRVGYLVGTRLPDRVLIRTFLLPTMQGTPESRELHRRLKLRRPDVEHLGLDDLETLATTDVLRDPEIAKIFEECGLGDLLKFVFEYCRGEIRGGHAKRFKSYLGLPSTGMDQLPDLNHMVRS